MFGKKAYFLLGLLSQLPCGDACKNLLYDYLYSFLWLGPH